MNNELKKLIYIIQFEKPEKILRDTKRIFSYHYPPKDFSSINKCFAQVVKLFNGKFPGYKACSTDYHNLNHTLTAFYTTVRLIDGYNTVKEPLSVKLAVDVLTASLLHDTGYIQELSDVHGTGGKYTENHVTRSIEILSKHYEEFGIPMSDKTLITKFINCTELKINPNTITFSNEEEKLTGFMLGTADILGQMSDREYLEKLLFLYREFREAKIPGYDTEFDILHKTLSFYNIIKMRLQNTLKAIYRYAKFHFAKRESIDKNLYIIAINKNISYLQAILNDNTTNFRKKLKRGDIVKRYEILTS